MTQAQWTAIDGYLIDRLVPADPALDGALAAARAAGLPAIDVAPNQGKLLHLLARMVGARRILEIGALGGYSAIWLARALAPGGRLTTLEIDPRNAEVARANFERAGLSDLIDLRLGPALETLPKLAAEGVGPFDLAFIDADKQSNADYFAWALRLSRPGSVIVVDNVVRAGRVIEAGTADPAVLGVRRLMDMLAAEPRVEGTAVQTVGSKGHDGFVIAWVKQA
ncbi:methyltransferase [Caulobacter sp. CCUG 60055]|uniref:O-methyltransferase n=1 Tax=Caulobacter sp. CCUG 60055 TaxID=2100090 RepID=UPI0003C19D7B|nr:O-methyltransferase [Caulobacter sp. CCUG 60055]MBQ1543859.1 O-methyltransferase [Caulobacteraceae bacterium]MCI3180679.1 methyltransferase [Caulobacter sp. CCUG 60055]